MRARKRNPYWGQGLDKRQARRRRRRLARTGRVIDHLAESADWRLEPWQEEYLRAIYVTGRQYGRGAFLDARRAMVTPRQR